VWVDAIELGLLSTNEERSDGLRHVVDNLGWRCRAMRKVPGASGPPGAPSVASCCSSKRASGEVGAKGRRKGCAAGLSGNDASDT
jgi:hypothetical protein